MAFTQVLPVQNRSGALQSDAVAWPAGATQGQVRLDVTPFVGPDAFSTPALSIAVSIELSYDGGGTWLPGTTSTYFGSPTGLWGRGFDACYIGVRPQPDHLPTHVRGGYEVGAGQTVRFGVSVQVA